MLPHQLQRNDKDVGRTLLYLASANGRLAAVELLLDRGADKDKANFFGDTPLYIASQNGHLAVVELLLARGADTDKANKEDGSTPLMAAARYGNLDVVERLLGRNACLYLRDKHGRTALEMARERGHAAIVDRLTQVREWGLLL